MLSNRGVDLASSTGDKNDFTVFSTIAHTLDNKHYLIDITSMKSDPAYHSDRLVEYYLKYKHDNVAIETVGYQETMRACQKNMRRKKNMDSGYWNLDLNREHLNQKELCLSFLW